MVAFSAKRLRWLPFQVRIIIIIIFFAMFFRLSMILFQLYEREVIYYYRRANWFTENILSRNCSKYNFQSLCPNNEIEVSISM